MSNSLKDQLIALGLANEPARGKRRNRRQSGRKPKSGSKANATLARNAAGKAGGGAGEDITLDEAWRLKARDEQQARKAAKAAKAAKQAADRERRLLNRKIQVIVDEHGQNDPKAELKRNFLYKGRIRSVLVNEAQLKALNGGELELVFLKGRYYVVTPEVAEQVKVLSAEHVPDLSVGSDDDEGDHPVPDDLIW